MPNCNNHENMVATENKILCELPLVSYFRDYGGLCGRGLGADDLLQKKLRIENDNLSVFQIW